MVNKFEQSYKKLLLKVLQEGEETKNRTKINTLKLFNENLIINLFEGFPIITGKKIYFKKALAEFKWIFEGRTDLKYLQDNNINWWNNFAINGKLGKVYGYQIKKYNNSIDQIKYCINEIKNNTRRAIITLWNPSDLKEQVLPCCYTQMNFVRCNNKLNLAMYFRSSDLFLGLPYDIIFGALFLIEISKQCNLVPYQLGLNLGDAHIYKNHINQINLYIKNNIYKLPKLKGNYNNYYLDNYISNKLIKVPLVV
jgi:thymidylate synthase